MEKQQPQLWWVNLKANYVFLSFFFKYIAKIWDSISAIFFFFTSCRLSTLSFQQHFNPSFFFPSLSYHLAKQGFNFFTELMQDSIFFFQPCKVTHCTKCDLFLLSKGKESGSFATQRSPTSSAFPFNFVWLCCSLKWKLKCQIILSPISW